MKNVAMLRYLPYQGPLLLP